MPKDSRKDQKRKCVGPADNGKLLNNMCPESINNFIKEHSKEVNINHVHLTNLNEQCEKMKFLSTCKKSTLDELIRSLDAKANALDEMTAKYEKLQSNFRNLHNALLLQNNKTADLETSYEQARKSLNDQLQHANKQMATVNTLLSAKEAECAAYLTDMRTQLEEANNKNAQAEERILELQTKVSELESILETKNEEETSERQNLIKEYEGEIHKNQKKLIKKNKRIDALEKKIKVLRDEKKALQNSLEMEGHKIRDLQRVLNRPINRASPVHDGNEIEERQIKHLEPLVDLQKTSSSSSRPVTPEVVLQTKEANQESKTNIPKRIQPLKRPLSFYNDNENEEINSISKIQPLQRPPSFYSNNNNENEPNNNNNVYQNQSQEVLDSSSTSVSTVYKRKTVQSENRSSTPMNTHNLKKTSLSKMDEGDTSDDMFFPSYIPNKNKDAGQKEATFKPIKRIRK